MSVAARPPRVGQLISVRVDLIAVRSGGDSAAAKQDLQRLAGDDSGAKLTRDNARRPFSRPEVHTSLIDQVVPVQEGGGQADQESYGLFLVRTTLQLEVFF